MTPAEQYRVKANEFLILANGEANPELQVEYARMAQSYLRLAELAERNSQTDIVYETPPPTEPPAPTA